MDPKTLQIIRHSLKL